MVGRPVAIRYDQLSARVPAAAGVVYACASDSGTVSPDGFAFTPRGPGVAAVAFTAHDSLGMTLASVATTVLAVPRTAGSGSASVLFVGDSIFAAYPWPYADSCYTVTFVRTAFEADGGADIRLLGTAGVPPGRHEAYIGRTWVDFTTAGADGLTNPFWNAVLPGLDFRHYMTASGQTAPIDYCVVQLGYNDLIICVGTVLTPEMLAVWLARIDSFVGALLAPETGYPGCRVVLSLPSSCNGSQAAWLACYSSLANWEVFETNVALYREALRERYDGGRHDPRVSVCASGVGVDRLAGYPANDYVHPNSYGHAQMAAAFYAHLRGLRRLEPQGVVGAAEPRAAAVPSLAPCVPNPFNPRTTLRCELPVAATARLAVYDLAGRRVRTLFAGRLGAGSREFAWDGRDDAGRALPSGVYFARLVADGNSATRRLTLAR